MKLFSSAILLIAVFSSLVGCKSNSGQPSSDQEGNDRVVLMLNWYPEAEHGGFYAAQVHGIFEEMGLDVEIRAGGPSAPVAQELVAGRVQFAIGNADDVLVFRQQEVPVVALLAPIQDTPRCILVHPNSNARDLSQLKGMTLQAGAGRPYLTFLEQKGYLEGVQVVPYSGVPKFVTDENSAMQGYNFSEPLLAKQQGVEPRLLMVSSEGFNPYASCLVATEEYIAANQDIVRRMVAACREGWKRYAESPDETNAAILEANQHGMTMDALVFGATELKPLCLPGDMPLEEIGKMEPSRWEALHQQFVDMKLVDPGKFEAGSVYQLDFLTESTTAE